jgi:hypothetical protein
MPLSPLFRNDQPQFPYGRSSSGAAGARQFDHALPAHVQHVAGACDQASKTLRSMCLARAAVASLLKARSAIASTVIPRIIGWRFSNADSNKDLGMQNDAELTSSVHVLSKNGHPANARAFCRCYQ